MTGRDPVDAAPPETLGPDRKWEGASRADQVGHDFGGRGAASPPSHPALPRFPVALVPPDLDPFLAGNTGIPGFTTMVGARPGPHVLLIALMHGNEISGAIVLDALLRDGFRPACGQLTVGFANIAAYRRFDRDEPTASRFIEEDLNRVWDPATLHSARRSLELDRARAIWPVIDSADWVLDLHSMLWPSDPLLLSGPGARGRALAEAIGTPPLVVADAGHAGGKRLIDHPRFSERNGGAACVLVEAGQHWAAEAVTQTAATVRALLTHAGMTEASDDQAAPMRRRRPPRFAQVTRVVTATSGRFRFVRPFRGGEVIGQEGTLIAHDGPAEIRTPHDDCLLVMPSHCTGRGHTAVRLARFAD